MWWIFESPPWKSPKMFFMVQRSRRKLLCWRNRSSWRRYAQLPTDFSPVSHCTTLWTTALADNVSSAWEILQNQMSIPLKKLVDVRAQYSRALWNEIWGQFWNEICGGQIWEICGQFWKEICGSEVDSPEMKSMNIFEMKSIRTVLKWNTWTVLEWNLRTSYKRNLQWSILIRNLRTVWNDISGLFLDEIVATNASM